MLPAGPVWRLLEHGGSGDVDGHVFFLLSLVAGAIGALMVGGVASIVQSHVRLVTVALVMEVALLVAMITHSGFGDRAFLSVAEAAVRTGACVALLLGPIRSTTEKPERVILERARWAAGGLLVGVLLGESVPPPTHGGVLAACSIALCVACLGVAWAGASTIEVRRTSDGFRHERA
jgi:hypothetical protein